MHLGIALPATGLLVARALSNKSLTNAGVVVAAITALAHAYHPWNTPFALLCVFFLAGTRVTHIKEDVKKTLTLSSKGASGGEGPRTHVQVLANSLVASILTVLHARQLYARQDAVRSLEPHLSDSFRCYAWRGDLLYVGIIANYAAVAADTFSSELGILSKGEPRLITSWTLRKVPRGTNGGVSLVGLLAGLFGSMVIVTTAIAFTPMCTDQYADKSGAGSSWTTEQKRTAMTFLVIWGALGSVLDSVLGGLFQSSVKDVRSGKIVEGEGGNRVLVTSTDCKTSHPSQTGISYAEAAAVHNTEEKKKAKQNMQATAVDEKDDESSKAKLETHLHQNWGDERPSRIAVNGMDVLDNNDVNFIMAVTMSVGAMFVASWYWGIPIQTVMSP
ncbi:hypothetical protein NLU13_4499 [Sarocladium strictum]|uniref:Uncharacterized protein n=1 Tax=Sarocladium strictum TaxID=5046 RepID=A0AA39GKN7_SARSR|nr:hypothetical protein NLU13_4499 [Sarocladium strictum]